MSDTLDRPARAIPEPRLPRPLEPVRLPETREELVDRADEHGLDVPDHGRLPQAVCDRYVGYRLRARRRLMRQRG